MATDDNDQRDNLCGLPPEGYLDALEFDSWREDNRSQSRVELAAQ